MMPKIARESGKRTSTVLPCLLGLTVAYQLVFQFIVWQKALPAAQEFESPILCWGPQKEQQAKYTANVDQCAEVKLFESWQTSGNDDILREGVDDWINSAPDLISVDPKGHIQLRELENHGFGEGTSTPVHQTIAVDIKASTEVVKSDSDETQQVDLTDLGKPLAMANPASESQITDQTKLQEDLEKDGFHLDHLKTAGFSSIHVPKSEAAEPLPKLEQNLVMEGFHLDHLKASGFSSVKFSGSTSAQWSTDIQALQKRVEGGIKQLKDLHRDTESEQAAANATKEPELLSKIESLQKELCADRSRQAHPECASLLGPGATPEAPKQVLVMGQMGSVTHKRITWNPPNTSNAAAEPASKPDSSAAHAHAMVRSSEWIASLSEVQEKLESRVRNATKMRRGRGTMKERKQAILESRKRDKTQLQEHVDDLKEGLAQIEHHRAVWESSLEARTMAIGIDLCSEESRRGNPGCKYFLEPHSHTAAETITTPTLEPAKDSTLLTLPTLAPAQSSKNSKFLEKRPNNQRLTLSSEAVYGKHWQGKIPKVACIMAIPTIPASWQNDTSKAAWLQYAVTNAVNAFRAEKYEGPKQLLVVHHHKDKIAARIASRLADGVYVKAVAAHLPVPSTMSMRYAAWSADNDTDVVARWDMNAYHHPERLSVQVRALGSSGRFVSALMWGVTFSEDGKRSVEGDEDGLESSMVGIRPWMDGHWHPYVANHSGPLARVSELVTLDMPELTKAPNPTETP